MASSPKKQRLLLTTTLSSLLLLTVTAKAHPVPDIPVRSYFGDDGQVEVRVEIDPRSFEDHPEEHDYLEKADAEKVSASDLADLGDKADRFVEKRLKFHFEPPGEMKPVFTWSFRTLGDIGPLENPSDPAVLVGSWKTSVPAESSGYRIESLPLTETEEIPMNVVFLNFLGGAQVERYAVLFPGEKSFLLDLAGLAMPLPGASPATGGQRASSNNLAETLSSGKKPGGLVVLSLILGAIAGIWLVRYRRIRR